MKVLIDALVLAGGRSSRLDSAPKARLSYQEHTLLENTVAAVSSLRSTVVVGDATGQTLPAEVLVTREEPVFGGPAAAIGAGVDRLLAAHALPSDVTVVLACDLPNIAVALPLLLRELHSTGLADSETMGDGLIAVDSAHRLQPLLAAYRTRSLANAVTLQREAGCLDGLSVFQLIRTLTLSELAIPDEAAGDVDTWADVDRWGIERPPVGTASADDKVDSGRDNHE